VSERGGNANHWRTGAWVCGYVVECAGDQVGHVAEGHGRPAVFGPGGHVQLVVHCQAETSLNVCCNKRGEGGNEDQQQVGKGWGLGRRQSLYLARQRTSGRRKGGPSISIYASETTQDTNRCNTTKHHLMVTTTPIPLLHTDFSSSRSPSASPNPRDPLPPIGMTVARSSTSIRKSPSRVPVSQDSAPTAHTSPDPILAHRARNENGRRENGTGAYESAPATK